MNYQIDKNLVKSTVKIRPKDADKTTVGTLLSICGSYGMAGAAIMSARSALRSGVGLLKLIVPQTVYPIMASAVPEAVFIPIKNNHAFDVESKSRYCNAVLCGCGLGVSEYSKDLLYKTLYRCELPMIFDADALNIIADDHDILGYAKAPVILTPHDREFARLLGCHTEMIKNKREELALSFAERNNVIVVLKGSKTIVASPDGDVLFNDELGNAGMAVGGSGDVLAGIIAALVAQGGDPFKSAAAGVYIHALAGDIAAEKFGEISLLPTDIIDCLPEAYKRLF